MRGHVSGVGELVSAETPSEGDSIVVPVAS